VRADRDEYARLALRAHSLLGDVPLHDVWAVDLPGGGPGRTILDLREIMAVESLTSTNGAVRFLFDLRAWLGSLFGWDREPLEAPRASYPERLSDDERRSSLVAPGTPEGAFRVLFVSPREAISEIHNSTVHAFSVFALAERSPGYRFYWGIYVRPVGWITSWYMRLIDPFRRLLIYPAVLRYVRATWERDVATPAV